jgi:hypothetical protein
MDKVSKASAISIVIFSIVLAGFIGSRVDQMTIALLGGTFIGLVVAIPATVLIVVIAMRKRDEASVERTHRYSTPNYSAPMPPSPPQYWVMPNQAYDPRATQVVQMPQQLQQPIAAPEFMLPATRRRFYMIGEGGDAQEIEAPHNADPYSDDGLRF